MRRSLLLALTIAAGIALLAACAEEAVNPYEPRVRDWGQIFSY